MSPGTESRTRNLTPALVFEGHGHPRAERLHFTVLELQIQAPHLGYAQVAQCLARLVHSRHRRLFPRLFARPHEFDDLVDAFAHDLFAPLRIIDSASMTSHNTDLGYSRSRAYYHSNAEVPP